ncbi:MAG: SRPBCC family protein [Devosia sp.]
MSFDLTAHMNAMSRSVRNLERDGKPAKAVVASCVYDTDPADLWDALTNKERLPRSFLPVSGDLKLGGHYQFEGNAGGTVTECIPHKRLAVTWEFGGGLSWVSLTLTPKGQSTLLELEHVAPIDPNFPPFGPGAVGVGWDLAFMGLGRHLTNPAAVYPPEEAANWSTSPEGKDFVREASTAWGDADIKAGEDPGKARAGAEMTRQFYTGEMQA